MTTAHVLGYPRIGAQRELKQALEGYWRGTLDEAQLRSCGRRLRARHWQLQREAGLDLVTVGDFAWYDHVLGTACHLGAVPERFGFDSQQLGLPQYFALARGDKRQPPMELTKWFDTNYHYLVPEWTADARFKGGVGWLFDEITEARALGHAVKVALVGPLTLLYLGKIRGREHAGLEHKLDLLPRLLPAYRRLLARIAATGVTWVQVDEPILGLDLDARWVRAFRDAYAALDGTQAKLLLATYFESVEEHCGLLAGLPVAGVHLDLVRGRGQLDAFLERWPQDRVLSLGVIDGRNVWRADLDAAALLLAPAWERLGERLWLAASCSLLHVPADVELERKLDPALRARLAYAAQKLEETARLKRMLEDRHAVPCAQAKQVERPGATVLEDATRKSPFDVRAAKQRSRLNLPLLPTTTIGSFPQTPQIRKARAAFKRGEIDERGYEVAMRAEIRAAVRHQEALGLDVLVHGEPERNDMVEYFAEQLEGYAVTENGWVQSYGSRCVKPPILHGEVSRARPMTVEWTRYAQSLTAKPMKGMLTGPITLLQWSFVREDQPRSRTALELAGALREEVLELEHAGIAIIQIDEPALREGLPLRKRDWPAYLDWAVRAFRVASCHVADETQIHTHMCYAEFNDILDSIVALDADVITIEASRSDMELLEAFAFLRYPNDIGPGLYDVHAPRVPDAEEIVRLLKKAERVIPRERLWVNPDCGLKTRDWPETEAALAAMVEAARRRRGETTSNALTAASAKQPLS